MLKYIPTKHFHNFHVFHALATWVYFDLSTADGMYSLSVSGVLQVTLQDTIFSLTILNVTEKQNELRLVSPTPTPTKPVLNWNAKNHKQGRQSLIIIMVLEKVLVHRLAYINSMFNSFLNSVLRLLSCCTT